MGMTKNDIDLSGVRPKTLGLLLVNGFPLMAYAAVVESYRAANALSGRQLYRWMHISVDGKPCEASNGATILPDLAVGEPIDCDMLFLFAGGDPTRFADRKTFGWLRRIGHGETVIVGLSGGAYLMGQAGLLEGRRATVHWEYREAFVDAFPSTICEPGLFVQDGRRITCAGGMAGMDLATQLIARDHGHALASGVSDWFIRSEPRRADRPQRLSLRERYGIANDRLLQVLGHMEEMVEEPVSREDLAAIAGVSVRQLERLFVRHLGAGIGAFYLRIRLDRGRQLLRSTAMTITAVAVACGFTSTSHFSRAFRAQFGHPPSADRLQTATTGIR